MRSRPATGRPQVTERIGGHEADVMFALLGDELLPRYVHRAQGDLVLQQASEPCTPEVQPPHSALHHGSAEDGQGVRRREPTVQHHTASAGATSGRPLGARGVLCKYEWPRLPWEEAWEPELLEARLQKGLAERGQHEWRHDGRESPRLCAWGGTQPRGAKSASPQRVLKGPVHDLPAVGRPK